MPKYLLTALYKLMNIVIPQLVLLFRISLLFGVLDSVSASNVSSSELAVACTELESFQQALYRGKG